MIIFLVRCDNLSCYILCVGPGETTLSCPSVLPIYTIPVSTQEHSLLHTYTHLYTYTLITYFCTYKHKRLQFYTLTNLQTFTLKQLHSYALTHLQGVFFLDFLRTTVESTRFHVRFKGYMVCFTLEKFLILAEW